MHIPKQYVNAALRIASEKMEKNGVSFDKKAIDAYVNSLKQKAKIHKFEENKFTPMGTLDEPIKMMYDLVSGLKDSFMQKSLADRNHTNIPEYIKAGYTYIYALAMKELGSPVIPNADLKSIDDSVGPMARELSNSRINFDISLDDYFNAQRGKDADELYNGGIGDLIEKTNKGTASPEELGELFAECRALMTRQEGHGRFWRWFHGKEQEYRSALIDDMTDALSKQIPDAADLLKRSADPLTTVRDAISGSIQKTVFDEHFKVHALKSKETFGYDGLAPESASINDVELDRESMKNDQQLLSDIAEAKLAGKSEPVASPKELNRGAISNG